MVEAQAVKSELTSLPADLVMRILAAGDHLETGLGYRDVANAARACRHIRDAVRSANLTERTLEWGALAASRRMRARRAR